MIDIISSVQQFAPTLYSVDNSRYLESQKYMLETIDESNIAAQNAATQLASAIGSLNFNESERWYKDKLLNDYDAMINGALDKYSGNLRLAMNDIMAKSRELSTNPEVLGRVQTNEQYKEWKQGIEKRQDISQDVKDYIIGTNPYHFELQITEVKDENGNPVLDEKGEKVTKVTGYKDFEGAEPVTQYTNMDIHKHILSILNPDTSSGSTITMYYTDENGNTVKTDDITKAQYYIDRSGKMEKLTKEKITDAIHQTLNDPRVDASLRQDYDVTKYKYKDGEVFLLNGNKYTINNDGQIIDKDGKALSYTDYELLRLEDITKTYGYTKFIGDTRLQPLVSKTQKDDGGPRYIPINPPTPTPSQASVAEVQPNDPNFAQNSGSQDSYSFEATTKTALDNLRNGIANIPTDTVHISFRTDSTAINQ
jgi:hypothetical protein